MGVCEVKIKLDIIANRIYIVINMKIKYSDEPISIREKIISFQDTHPWIYELIYQKLETIRKLDYEAFCEDIKQELKKDDKDRGKTVKHWNDVYEYRIPPHSQKGVARIFFRIEPDEYTITITDCKFKQWLQPQKTGVKNEKRRRKAKKRKSKRA